MSKELLSKELMKKEYPILGPSLMAKKYNVRRRYCICRASNLGIKFKKKKRTFCKNCSKEVFQYNTLQKKYYCSNSKSGLCGSCSAKLKYKKQGAFTHNNGRIFTEQETDILKEKYYDSEKKELLKLLNRSWCSIQHKAERLKIKRNPKFMEEGNKKGRKFFRSINNPIANPNRMTSIEKKISNLLNKLKINYKFNELIKTNTNVRFPDFRIGKLIIECDGKYWHKNKYKENKRDKELIKAGFEILHFSEDKINKNIKKVEKCILSKLN